jgi:hypothetical protein
MQKRINLSIDPQLHEDAKVHAKETHFTDFSGLVTKLIVADIARYKAGGDLSQSAKAAANHARQEVSDRKKDPGSRRH